MTPLGARHSVAGLCLLRWRSFQNAIPQNTATPVGGALPRPRDGVKYIQLIQISLMSGRTKRHYGVVNFLTGLVTPSLLPLGSVESTL
jgi:hypothetical protein